MGKPQETRSDGWRWLGDERFSWTFFFERRGLDRKGKGEQVEKI